MSRRTARKHIFNVIFQSEFNQEIELKESLAMYREEFEDYEQGDENFIETELKGILEHKSEIDDAINNYAEGWSVERIAKVDIAILRLAVYEILFAEDIPNRVAVNEAVELAKEFSSDKSPSFINGILGKVVSNSEEK